MENKDIILVLETFKKNPNIDIRNMYKLIDDKISWKNLLNVFTKVSEEGLIKRQNNSGEITRLGDNKLFELKKDLKTNSEIQQLTIKELKGNVFQLKFWWLIILVNAIISLIISVLIKS